MKYAENITEIINAFSPSPLKAGEMDEFYCDETMEYRMSDKYSSPIEDIIDLCQIPTDRNAFLLLGHKGCGKSTELNQMSKKLEDIGYQVKTISCSVDLDLFNIVHSDLFILLGEALLNIAMNINLEINKETLKKIESFWADVAVIQVESEMANLSIESGVTVEMPAILKNIFNIYAKMKADLKYNEETRKEYRQKITIRSSEWLMLLKNIADQITDKLDGKQPIIIFEDLDKLNPDDAWKIFYNYAALLSGVSFPVIYTFPIALSYDPKFSALEGYFVAKTLPMIKIQTIDGDEYVDGVNVVKEIVKKRVRLELFEENVLDDLIQYTGGSLRDLFLAINISATRAVRRKSDTIAMDDIDRALEDLKTSLTRKIERDDYEFLKNIYYGNKELIENKQMLLKMLQASVVLEYNGKRWHNVHPLVVKFLKEQRILDE